MLFAGGHCHLGKETLINQIPNYLGVHNCPSVGFDDHCTPPLTVESRAQGHRLTSGFLQAPLSFSAGVPGSFVTVWVHPELVTGCCREKPKRQFPIIRRNFPFSLIGPALSRVPSARLPRRSCRELARRVPVLLAAIPAAALAPCAACCGVPHPRRGPRTA